jgi:hypothetical protein
VLIQEAFLAGLDLVRQAGFPAKGNHVQVIAASRVFETAARGKEHDERFPVEGPQYAKRLILLAYRGKDEQ